MMRKFTPSRSVNRFTPSKGVIPPLRLAISRASFTPLGSVNLSYALQLAYIYAFVLPVYYCSKQHSCCNPLGLHPTTSDSQADSSKKQKNISGVEITISMRQREKEIGLNLIPGQKICTKCKVQLYAKLSVLRKEKEDAAKLGQQVISARLDSSPSIHSSQVSSHSSQQTHGQFAVSNMCDVPFIVNEMDGLNAWLESQGFPPISIARLKRHASYRAQILNNLKTGIEKISETVFTEDERILYFKEMIVQLQNFITNTSANSKKILALTVLPSAMSLTKVQSTFGVSSHLARKARAIVEADGILSEPEKKMGRSLSAETTQPVKSFYLRDEISRPLPGRKDVVSVVIQHEDGKKERVAERKRLVLGTLGSIHATFVQEHANNYVSLGKFCALRPKQCVLAGRAGTHVVCVCTYHENPHLMFGHGHLKCDSLRTVRDCRDLLLCENPTRDCHLRSCIKCPDSLNLQEVLEVHLDSEVVDSVTYNQWESTDRGNLVTLTKSTEDFIDEFVAQIEFLIPHDFIYQQQVDFIKNKTENLIEGEIIINGDFGENFSFVIQRSSQSSYFDTPRATIHPFVIYYKEDGQLKHHCFVIISDHMQHNTVAVHALQKKVTDFVTNVLKIKVTKIFYVFDGCAAQYKNKKAVANLWFHEKDFGMPAEWHYSATSHGKSGCDGATGRLKALVYQASLQATEPGQQITTPYAMFTWVKENVKGMTSEYVSTAEVKAHEAELMIRFGTALEIEGIQSHHAIIPCEDEPFVKLKIISNDANFVLRKISPRECHIDFNDVRGFILYSLDKENLQLGTVCESDIFNESFSVQKLSPTPKMYCYEFTEEVIEVFLQDIVCLVNPYFQKKGTVVKVFAKDLKAAQVKLKNAV